MDFTTLLQQLIIYKGLLDDFGYCAREEDGVCGGSDLMVKDSLCGKVNSMTSGLFHPRSFGGNVRVVREDIFHLKYMQQEGRCFEKMTRDILG